MRRVLISVVGCLVLSLAACQGMHRRESRGEESHGMAVKFGHVVIVRLKDPGDEEARRKIVEASRSFEKIPGVVRVHVGWAVAGTRPEKIPDFDVGVMVGFGSKEDMAAYVADPIHKKAASEVLAPLAKDFSFYDFTDE